MIDASLTGERIHFVTGKLSEHALRNMLERLAGQIGFQPTVQVLNITVAALMTTDWIARRLEVPEGTDRVVIPGLCKGDMTSLEQKAGMPVERGPEDCRRLDEWFGQKRQDLDGYGEHDIELIAEINHANRFSQTNLLAEATRLRLLGADVIDVGCTPGESWAGIGAAVSMLVEEGIRVSVDSFEPGEVVAATRAGASLVLSVNSRNVEAAGDWGCEVVVVPDEPSTLRHFDETIARLDSLAVPYRLDPVLEPIGFGFAASLGRYLEIRKRYPESEIMMGVGNLTELTDVDSAGVNTLLLGFCQETGIRSVLTTEVIHWAQSSVRECDLARRLVYHAVVNKTLPKHVEPRLVTLRSGKQQVHGDEAIEQLASAIRDPNFRVFAERGEVHLVGKNLHLSARDPFQLFYQLAEHGRSDVDANHAFYLGYEMAKAMTALTLEKDYRQDQSLDWGYLTEPEIGCAPSVAAARVVDQK
jgi:dihydropteroate synthase-like protein